MKHEEAYELPRGGIHLLINPQERYSVYGYKGTQYGPLCNTGDGHFHSTDRLSEVTCKCCKALADLHRLKGGTP